MIQIKRDLTRKGILTRKDTQMTKTKDKDRIKEDLSMETFNNRNQVMCQHTEQIQVWPHQLFKASHMDNRLTWLLHNTCLLSNSNSNNNNSSNSTSLNPTNSNSKLLIINIHSSNSIQIKPKAACSSIQLPNKIKIINSKEANNNISNHP